MKAFLTWVTWSLKICLLSVVSFERFQFIITNLSLLRCQVQIFLRRCWLLCQNVNKTSIFISNLNFLSDFKKIQYFSWKCNFVCLFLLLTATIWQDFFDVFLPLYNSRIFLVATYCDNLTTFLTFSKNSVFQFCFLKSIEIFNNNKKNIRENFLAIFSENQLFALGTFSI